jgi:hypothetical protein
MNPSFDYTAFPVYFVPLSLAVALSDAINIIERKKTKNSDFR